MKTALVLALLLGACHRGPSPTECKAQVGDMMTFLRAMDHTRSPWTDLGLTLATRTDMPAFDVHEAPVVLVRADKLEFRGEPVELARLGDLLATERARIMADLDAGKFSRADPPDPTDLYVLADAAATWGAVVAVTDAARHAGLVHVRFAFAKPSPVKPPPPSPIDDSFKRVIDDDSVNKATAIAKLISDLVKPCPQLVAVFGRVAAYDGDDRASAIIEGTGPALIDCSCKADVASVRNALWFVNGNPHPTAVLPVTLADDGTELALPATTAWRDVAGKLVAGNAHYVSR